MLHCLGREEFFLLNNHLHRFDLLHYFFLIFFHYAIQNCNIFGFQKTVPSMLGSYLIDPKSTISSDGSIVKSRHKRLVDGIDIDRVISIMFGPAGVTNSIIFVTWINGTRLIGWILGGKLMIF